MSTQHHQSELLGPYVLGVLDETEKREVEEHTASCEECRGELAELQEMETLLADLPPEAFLEGPPDDGELLLQRTLRQVRSERTATIRRRSFAVTLAAAASAAVVFFGGYLTAGNGSTGAEAGRVLPTATATAPSTPAPAGVVVASAKDTATQAGMTVRLTPAAGWVRVGAAVTGVPAGERCRLIVVAKDGHREIAGSWVVGDDGKGGGKGADLDGSASVKPGDVKSVVVENEQGKQFVSVGIPA